MKSSLKKKNYLIGYLFMLPFLALFFIFVAVPVFLALIISFTNYNMLQLPSFVGINNYKLLLMDDSIFITALTNTLIFAFVTGPISYFLSFLLSWVINSLKGKTAYALGFYAPSIVSSVAMSVIWMYFFSGDRFGLFNNLLLNTGLISSPIQWTQDAEYILNVIIIIQIWMGMGTNFLVFLAGLQNVPAEFYEAARIDGTSGRLQELRFITIPIMKPQLLFGAINVIVSSFGVFDIAVSVAGMPSPNYAAHTIVAHLYDYAFIRFQMGYASSVAVILFILTFILGQVVMRMLRSDY